MTHTYTISGATCSGCLNTIKEILSKLPEVESLKAQLEPPVATIKLSKHVNLDYLNQALVTAGKGKYTLSNEQMMHNLTQESTDSIAETTTWKNYIPLMVIIGYIFGGSVLLTNLLDFNSMISGMPMSSGWNWMLFMNMLMGLWFIFFSLFKMLDLKGFAEGYSTYDIIANKWYGWGFVYPFVELALGIAYLSSFQMFYTSLIAFIVMSVASIGVILNTLDGKKFQCACLGTILKVPLTKITLIENLSMALMALAMMFMMI